MKNCLCFFIFIVFFSCDPGDDRLTIINNTDHCIVVSNYLWISDSSKTYLNNKRYTDSNFMVNQVESKNSFKMIKKGSWEDSFVESDTIIILVHNRDSIVEKRLKKPSQNYEVEQMIYVSHDYLKKNDWKINIDKNNASKIIKL
jgi:hypothetical protein